MGLARGNEGAAVVEVGAGHSGAVDPSLLSVRRLVHPSINACCSSDVAVVLRLKSVIAAEHCQLLTPSSQPCFLRRCCHRRAVQRVVAAAPFQVNSETDFVARNEQFQGLVTSAAAAALGVSALRQGSAVELDAGALAAARMPGGST